MDTLPPSALLACIAQFFQALTDRVSFRPGGLAPWEAAPRMPAALVRVIVFRIRRLHRHLARLVTSAAQTPRPPLPRTRPASPRRPGIDRRRSGAMARPGVGPGTAIGAAGLVLPRRFAWLPGVLTDATDLQAQLIQLLADPELAALAAVEPRIQRVLRPLAHMMGVAADPALVALKPCPPRARAARPSRARASRPWARRSGVMAEDYPRSSAGLRARPG